MKVSKQQKILGGLMLIGLVLVGADQLGWLPGRGSVSADAQAPIAPEKEYAIAPVPGAATAAVPAVPVAQRLRQAATACANKPVHDAFAPGSAWVVAVGAAPVNNTGTVEQFKAAHRLTGVLTSGGRCHAMLDGKIITIGQNVDGFKLVAVSGRSATFESRELGGSNVVLSMTERSTAVAGVAP